MKSGQYEDFSQFGSTMFTAIEYLYFNEKLSNVYFLGHKHKIN